MKKPVEKDARFLELLDEWQKLEDRAIESAEEMTGSSMNPFIKMTMQLIKHDSEKHKIVLQMVRESVTTESLNLSPGELASLSDLLNKHLQMEAGALKFADEAFSRSELFVTRYLLSYLMADEEKHHGMIVQLNELKRASIPSSTGARSYGCNGKRPCMHGKEKAL